VAWRSSYVVPDGVRRAERSHRLCQRPTDSGPAQGDAGNGDIYSLDPAIGRSHDLSRSTDDDRAPAFSPDGTRIAFVRTSFPAKKALWLMRRGGRVQRRLVDPRVTGDIGAHPVPASRAFWNFIP
jgi:hypothetical protein